MAPAQAKNMKELSLVIDTNIVCSSRNTESTMRQFIAPIRTSEGLTKKVASSSVEGITGKATLLRAPAQSKKKKTGVLTAKVQLIPASADTIGIRRGGRILNQEKRQLLEERRDEQHR